MRIPTILVFGLVFVVAGIGFKLGAVPFHMWVPDVYHGAPTAVTLLIGTAPKLAAFAFIMRLLVEALGVQQLLVEWQQMLVILAVAVAGDRQHHRDRADQSEAHARLFDHLAHGLPAARHPQRHARADSARRCSTSSFTC